MLPATSSLQICSYYISTKVFNELAEEIELCQSKQVLSSAVSQQIKLKLDLTEFAISVLKCKLQIIEHLLFLPNLDEKKFSKANKNFVHSLQKVREQQLIAYEDYLNARDYVAVDNQLKEITPQIKLELIKYFSLLLQRKINKTCFYVDNLTNLVKNKIKLESAISKKTHLYESKFKELTELSMQNQLSCIQATILQQIQQILLKQTSITRNSIYLKSSNIGVFNLEIDAETLNEHIFNYIIEKNSLEGMEIQEAKCGNKFTENFQKNRLGTSWTYIECKDGTISDLRSLQPFIHKNLKHLVLKNCSEMTHHVIHSIGKQCLYLESLHIEACMHLTEIGSRSLFTPTLQFPCLRNVIISYCPHLTFLRLEAFPLSQLTIQNNEQLHTIHINACWGHVKLLNGHRRTKLIHLGRIKSKPEQHFFAIDFMKYREIFALQWTEYYANNGGKPPISVESALMQYQNGWLEKLVW